VKGGKIKEDTRFSEKLLFDSGAGRNIEQSRGETIVVEFLEQAIIMSVLQNLLKEMLHRGYILCFLTCISDANKIAVVPLY
jgi:hypothetical protein